MTGSGGLDGFGFVVNKTTASTARTEKRGGRAEVSNEILFIIYHLGFQFNCVSVFTAVSALISAVRSAIIAVIGDRKLI